MAYSIRRGARRHGFETAMECDLSFQTPDGERFRANVHLQRGRAGMAARVPGLKELGLPPVLQQQAFLKGAWC